MIYAHQTKTYKFQPTTGQNGEPLDDVDLHVISASRDGAFDTHPLGHFRNR